MPLNKGTPKLTLADDWNLIQVEWAINSVPAPAPSDAICKVSVIDGPAAPLSAETTVRNAQYRTRGVRMGFLGATISTQTAGDQCFDDYQSFRTLAP